MKKILVITLMLAFFSCNPTTEPTRELKIILALLAHPDDETAFAPVLAKYAGEGKKVVLVVAADGRYGVEEHAGIPPGDSLAAIRKQETLCACEILGVKDTMFLGFHDGLGLMTGIGEYFRQTTALKERIKEVIEQVQPDAIITFGPDGDTGHPDHKAISDFTTEIVLREGWYEQYPLYYLGWQKEKKTWIPQGGLSSLNYVHKDYLATQIAYSSDDKEKALKAISCYKTQFAPADMEKMIAVEKEDPVLVTYFRQLKVDKTVKTGL